MLSHLPADRYGRVIVRGETEPGQFISKGNFIAGGVLRRMMERQLLLSGADRNGPATELGCSINNQRHR